MLKIDMHAHILPPDWPDIGARHDVRGFPTIRHSPEGSFIVVDGADFRQVWPNSWDAELRIEEYAQHGVDVQVISTVPILFCYHGEPEHTSELARYLNDHVAELQARYPKNYIALGTVPMQSVSAAIDELKRLAEQLDVRGIQIGSNVNDRNLDDPELFEILSAAQDLDLAVMVHPWQMMGRELMKKYWLPWLVGMPAELSRAICSMIFGGVFERLPELRVCFAHGGGSFPYTIGRIEHGFNMRPDLVAMDNPVNPRDYLGRFWVDSVTHDPQALKYLMDVVGSESIMLGTDYPFPLGEQIPGSVIEQLQPEQDVLEGLMFRNCLQWLQIDEEAFQ